MLLDLSWKILRPALFSMDAERAHEWTLQQSAMWPSMLRLLAERPVQSCQVGPLTWGGPIGLAAGLDKNGIAIPAWEALGFGAIEVGTVTAIPQEGNPKPRLFRLIPERAIINRMGFNNLGAEALAANLGALKAKGHWPKVPVGANLGKSKVVPNEEAIGDYLKSLEYLEGKADYFTINISSPNTPNLRALQDKEPLQRLLGAIIPAAKATPVFLKLAPDLTAEALTEAVDVAIAAGCSGLIATNTTISRPDTTGRLNEQGGLSGLPLKTLAQSGIRTVLQAAAGRVPVVGVGGIGTVEDAHALLKMGCAALQIYTSLIYEGPALVGRLHRGLAAQS